MNDNDEISIAPWRKLGDALSEIIARIMRNQLDPSRGDQIAQDQPKQHARETRAQF